MPGLGTRGTQENARGNTKEREKQRKGQRRASDDSRNLYKGMRMISCQRRAESRSESGAERESVGGEITRERERDQEGQRGRERERD